MPAILATAMSNEEPGDLMDYLAGLPIANARRIGLMMLGVGALILGVNVFSLFSEGSYYPFTLPVGFPALLAGLCLAVIGQPRSRAGTPALWGRVFLVASATAGAGVGLGLAISMCG